jgi:hypothetical protein
MTNSALPINFVVEAMGIAKSSTHPASLISVARLAAASRAALYVVGAHGSAGIEGFERASVQAPFMLLGIRKHAHDNQSRYDNSS